LGEPLRHSAPLVRRWLASGYSLHHAHAHQRCASRVVPLLSLSLRSNWGKLIYALESAAFIFKIKRSADFENKTSEK
jgi:hypothetical protein